MNTNMAGFISFSKVCILVIWTKVASSLIGLRFHVAKFRLYQNEMKKNFGRKDTLFEGVLHL